MVEVRCSDDLSPLATDSATGMPQPVAHRLRLTAKERALEQQWAGPGRALKDLAELVAKPPRSGQQAASC